MTDVLPAREPAGLGEKSRKAHARRWSKGWGCFKERAPHPCVSETVVEFSRWGGACPTPSASRPFTLGCFVFGARTIVWEPGHRPSLVRPDSCQGRYARTCKAGTRELPLLISIVGIDVAKATLDVWFRGMSTPRQFSNDEAGFAELIAFLGEHAPPAGTVVGLEASGGYERAVCRTLHHSGIGVRVHNPACVRYFARAIGKLAKNDRLDARVIVRYTEVADTQAFEFDAGMAEFAEVVAQRRRLVDDRVAISNQRRS